MILLRMICAGTCRVNRTGEAADIAIYSDPPHR